MRTFAPRLSSSLATAFPEKCVMVRMETITAIPSTIAMKLVMSWLGRSNSSFQTSRKVVTCGFPSKNREVSLLRRRRTRATTASTARGDSLQDHLPQGLLGGRPLDLARQVRRRDKHK